MELLEPLPLEPLPLGLGPKVASSQAQVTALSLKKGRVLSPITNSCAFLLLKRPRRNPAELLVAGQRWHLNKSVLRRWDQEKLEEVFSF
jgi:hypothetical protein